MRIEITDRAREISAQIDAELAADHIKMNGWKDTTAEQLIEFWRERGEVYKKLNAELKEEVYGRMPAHLREAYEDYNERKRIEAYRNRKIAA